MKRYQILKYSFIGLGFLLASCNQDAPSPLDIMENDKPVLIVLQDGYDQFPSVAASIAFIHTPDMKIISDPGMSPDFNLVVKRLNDLGVSVNDITHVFITHYHPDHTINMGRFPNATIVDKDSSYKADNWGEHDPENYELTKNITIIATPGHATEGATMFVDTNKGVYALTHAWWHSDMTPKLDPFAVDQAALDNSRAVILKRADWILPGHGKMFRNSPSK